MITVNKMAVLITSEAGWVISHESLINNIFKNTIDQNEIKSYCLNPSLFDIEIPFVNKKCNKSISNEKGETDVQIVKKAYNNLYKLYKSFIKVPTDSQKESNKSARLLSDRFYCQLTHHLESNFLGGNSSQNPLVTKISEGYYLIPDNSIFYSYDIKEVSEHLKNKEFDLIVIDPPWWNKFIRRKRKKNNKFGYEMVYDKELSKIPINTLLDENGIIIVWCTSAPSHINTILNTLFPAWNVQFLAQWFWLKITKFGEPICDFSQHLKKQPFERIIIGTKKDSVRSLPNPENKKVIMSIPSAIHSHKPPVCEILKPYLPEEPKCLELFARYLLPNWTSYGNEVLKLQHMSLYNEAVERS